MTLPPSDLHKRGYSFLKHSPLLLLFQSEYKATELTLQLQNARDDAENDERRRQRKLADSDERKQQLQEKVCTSAYQDRRGRRGRVERGVRSPTWRIF